MDTYRTTSPRCILWASRALRDEAAERAIQRTLADSEAYVDRTNGIVVDRLTARGVSRHASSFEALRDRAAARGQNAWAQLEAHWLARDFDLLVAADAQELTRSAQVYDEIVRRTLTYGARIYLVRHACLIDATSYRALTFAEEG